MRRTVGVSDRAAVQVLLQSMDLASQRLPYIALRSLGRE